VKTLPREVLAKLPPGRGVNPAALAGGAAVDLAALLGPDPLEAEFQAAVVQIAQRGGWQVYHVPDSRRVLAGGFPDLVLMRATGPTPLMAAELKRKGEKPRKDQEQWLTAFRCAGVPTFVWRPADIQTIREVLK
jgi:hypothetical protein